MRTLGPETAEKFGECLFDITWNAIGHDAFQVNWDGKRRHLYRRSEVFDMCFDNLLIAQETSRGTITKDSVRGLQHHFMALSKNKQGKFIKAVLPSRYYGE